MNNSTLSKNSKYISPIVGKYPTPTDEPGVWISLDAAMMRLKGIIHKVTIIRYLTSDKLVHYSRFSKKIYLLTDELPDFYNMIDELIKDGKIGGA